MGNDKWGAVSVFIAVLLVVLAITLTDPVVRFIRLELRFQGKKQESIIEAKSSGLESRNVLNALKQLPESEIQQLADEIRANINKEKKMIARTWKGWTKIENANAYKKYLKEVIYTNLQDINGYCGGYIFRQDGENETEFMTVNLFSSIEAVKAFAGSDYEVPVIEPTGRRLLLKIEPIARHYDVKKTP